MRIAIKKLKRGRMFQMNEKGALYIKATKHEQINHYNAINIKTGCDWIVHGDYPVIPITYLIIITNEGGQDGTAQS